jgi:transposase
MRYELTDQEWAAIKPMLPNKPRGVTSQLNHTIQLTQRHYASTTTYSSSTVTAKVSAR